MHGGVVPGRGRKVPGEESARGRKCPGGGEPVPGQVPGQVPRQVPGQVPGPAEGGCVLPVCARSIHQAPRVSPAPPGGASTPPPGSP